MNDFSEMQKSTQDFSPFPIMTLFVLSFRLPEAKQGGTCLSLSLRLSLFLLLLNILFSDRALQGGMEGERIP